MDKLLVLYLQELISASNHNIGKKTVFWILTLVAYLAPGIDMTEEKMGGWGFESNGQALAELQ